MEYKYPERDQSQKWVDGERWAFNSSGSFTISNVDSRWLYYTDVKQVGETYVATGLAVGHRGESSFFREASMLLDPCEGTVTLAKDSWRFDVSGSKECEAYAGTFVPSGKKAAEPADPACGRYTLCVCALQKEWPKLNTAGDNPFAAICTESKGLLETAKDDPATCKMGMKTFGAMAKELGLSAKECE